MTVHEQFADDLALYALGALSGEERIPLESHLQECASCRRELEQLRGDAALLAISTAGPRPPARAKTRLMDAIAGEPRTQPSRSRLNWWAILGWATAGLMLVFVIGVSRHNKRLSSTVAELSGMVEHERVASDRARRVSEVLHASDATPYEILPVSMKTRMPAGKAIYSRDQNGLIFVASNLQPPPAQKAYELWLIPSQGAPIPAGTFKPDSRGMAMVVNPPLPAGVEAKAFAITIEPEQGSSAPTSGIIMMGAGS
ncbi:MAG TPA: anti-sigma factor [Terriglobales bacterium]|jgi:anti-sigma-K factor RskA|nr:anti-sigma factor [Terriglobales bacterium]